MTEREILLAASGHADPAARSAFLDAACGGDTALRERVEQLLESGVDNPPDPRTAYTPAVSDNVTRTIAPVGPADLDAGPTRTVAPNADNPDFAETKAPDDGFGDVDLAKLLSPAQEEGSLGRLDHYEVLEIVGRGGMGVVLRAHDTKLRRVVAVKLLAPALAAVGTARKRFAREAQSAAAVRDKHVVDIHAVCEDAAVPYLVMEFVSGITLEDRLRAEGPMEPAEAVRIGLQSARGLAAAHAQGLVHRDVKPGNILLEGGSGAVKLTDFGLARAADDASISRSGVIAGTPMYMSPEQAKGDHIDHRSDLFSLGSVLYTLLTGRPAFRAETTVAVIRRVCKDTPRPIREVSPGVPRWVCAVVEKLMAKDPDERIQSAEEVAELLERYLAHLADPDRVPPPPAVRGVRASARRRARIWAAGVVGIFAIAALGVAGYEVFGPSDETAAPVPNRGAEQAGWRPATAEELAARPSPLDGRTREQISAGLLSFAGGGDPGRVPPNAIAILGDGRFRVPRVAQPSTHVEIRQDRDGKWLAVPNGDSVVVFDARTGERFRILSGRGDRPHTVAFSSDGKYLAGATSSDDKRPYGVKVWELQTGREVTFLQATAGASWAVAFGPDGKQIFCSGPKGLDVWDIASEKIVRSFPAVGADKHYLYSLALSPDGKKLVWGDDSAKVKVWTIGSEDPPTMLDGHTASIRYAAFAPGGKFLATGNDRELILWDAQLQFVKKIDTPARWLAFDPSGAAVFTSTCAAAPNAENHPVTRWTVATFRGQALAPLGPKTGHVQLSTDGKTLFFLVGDGKEIPRYVRPHSAATSQPVPAQGHGGEVWAVAVNPDGRSVASGGDDGTIRLWDLGGWVAGTPQPPNRTLTGHTATVRSLAFSPNGKLIVSGSKDGTIRLWDAVAGTPVRILPGEKDKLSSELAFSADGKLVAAGDETGSVRLWDVASGQPQQPLRWHSQSVNAVAVSPDGRYLASAGLNDRKVHVTDLRTSRRVQTLGPAGDGRAEMRVAFAGDGHTLAYGGWDANVRLWDMVEKKETVLTGAGPNLGGLATDPTGRFVAATVGATVRFWDRTAPNRPVTIGPGPFGSAARSIAFTPEGRYLVVAGGNGIVSILRTPTLAPVSPEASKLSSAEAVKRLRTELEAGSTSLADLADAEFARSPLTKTDAAAARALLWNAHAAFVRKDRAEEMKEKLIKDGNLEMPFTYQTFGEKPKDGWSLYVSLHGGGGGSKEGNDQQWERHKTLYTPEEGIYLTPRAPTDTWNLWHDSHIDRMLPRLIEDMIALEGVNPNRVYLLGYAGGGDGVYQLAPRMADRWAAAAMMAGHPNNVSPLSLRNVPFALQVGANDTQFSRNKVGREYGEALSQLKGNDPKGYEHFVKIHAGKGTWMDGEDKVALPWMAKFTRNPIPDRVVWKQTGVHTAPVRAVLSPQHDHLYWLAIPPGEGKLDSLVVANRDGQTVEIAVAEQVGRLLIRLDDRMLDLNKPVRVTYGGKELFVGEPPRTIGVMIRTLVGRGDPGLMFDAEVEVELPGLDSPDTEMHVNVGVALLKMSQLDAAIARLRKAIELDPKHAFAHDRLAAGLLSQGHLDEAIASINKAIELDSNLATAHNNLGVALVQKGQVDEAITSHRRAVELDPKLAIAHSNLGRVLAIKNQVDEAIACYRKAIELDPKSALYHASLGFTLGRKGEYEAAAASYRKSLELAPNLATAQRGLEQILKLVATQEKLPAFLKGEFKPETNEERVALSEVCRNKKLYRAAANLEAESFDADPTLVDEPNSVRRYNAACYAALAAAGQGEDAAGLDENERARLRKLALDWLNAELDAHAKRLRSGRTTDRNAVIRTMNHWRRDADLAGVRDVAALEKLPAAERTAFTKLWTDATTLEKDAEASGVLNDAEIRRIAALPAVEQVAEVRKELKRRNPDFDGVITPTIKDGVVTGLSMKSDLVADLAPVRAFTQLRRLDLFANGARRLVDLTPLRGLPLTELHSNGNLVKDLSPLKGMQLDHLMLWGWRGTDLTPLKGMPLKNLNIGGGGQKLDLTPLASMPLEYLVLNFSLTTDLTPLKNMPLKHLSCTNTPVSDLTPLRGMRLEELYMFKTKVTDLSPLKGMPLTILRCEDTGVTDLSPLKDMPLKQLGCPFRIERDGEILRSIKTLEKINDKPVAEFWKAFEK